jgi:hypothetical protein
MRRILRLAIPAPIRARRRRWLRDERLDALRTACALPGGTPTRLASGQIPHYCLPLDDPHWRTAATANDIAPDASVLGFEIDGRAHAVPWDVMAAHHVVNLVVGGQNLVLTLCDACVGGGLFDADVDGARLRFRVDGTFDGTPYVIDTPTGSFWTMVTMRPLAGPAMSSGPLRRRPVVHATWAEWRRLRPDSLVIDSPGEPPDGHGASHRWPGHAHLPNFAEGAVVNDDARLDPLDLVLGVEVGASARAYPLDALAEAGGVVNDELGGEPIVAIALRGTYTALAFRRELDGRTLTFEWADESSGLLGDVETGSRWDLFGRALEGELAESQLRFAWSGIQKWFNWSNLAPGAPIWSPER